jgi:hypothetical protein
MHAESCGNDSLFPFFRYHLLLLEESSRAGRPERVRTVYAKGVEMLRYERRIIGLFLPIALVGMLSLATSASAQRVRVETHAFTAPHLSVGADPQLITVCEGAGPSVVRLNARATSDYPIRYRWSSNVGRIDGDGETVNWDLSGAAPGRYRAYVDIDTGSGDEACEAFASTTVVVNRCPPVPPVCPNVAIICPERAELGQVLTFSSNITGGTQGIAAIYNWTVSAGQLIEGQGTPTIRVNTTGLSGGETVTASLSMGGYVLDCSATCSVSFPVPLECRKFDEYSDIAYNDEKARLDNFAIGLQNDPTATGYVVVNPEANRRAGDAQRRTTRAVDYLVNSRGLSANRIVSLVGPSRDHLLVELWLCPQGARLPTIR